MADPNTVLTIPGSIAIGILGKMLHEAWRSRNGRSRLTEDRVRLIIREELNSISTHLAAMQNRLTIIETRSRRRSDNG